MKGFSVKAWSRPEFIAMHASPSGRPVFLSCFDLYLPGPWTNSASLFADPLPTSYLII